MLRILDFIIPERDLSPESVLQWRYKVAGLLICLTAFASWSITPWGFARASSVQTQISGAISPLEQAISEQGREIQETQQLVKDSRAEDYEARIVDYKTKLCKATSPESRQTWSALVLMYQNRYIRLTGRNFPAPLCSEL